MPDITHPKLGPSAAAHDMFVKPAQFFAAENTEVLVRVLN